MEYEKAIKEFDQLTSHDDRVKEVYAHFGLAIFNAQILEQQAINLIAFCRLSKNRSLSSDEINTLWDSYDHGNKTLGMLITEIQQQYKLSDEDYAEFKELLKLRNYITHDYFRHNSGIWYAREGMKRVIKDFCSFIDRRKKFDGKLQEYILQFANEFGYTKEKFEEMLVELEKEWSNKTIDDSFKTFKK